LQDTPASSDEGFEAQTRAFELGLLRRALHNTGWNQRKTAEILKLSYDQFRHLYRKYELDKEKP
jgi:DNA-binding NtrC family response regulator